MPDASLSIDGTTVISKTSGNITYDTGTFNGTIGASATGTFNGTFNGTIGASATFSPGYTPSNPGTSAKQLMDDYDYDQNGWYWIKPGSNVPAIYTYCDFTNEGGGWTAYRMYGHNNYPGGGTNFTRNDNATVYSTLHQFADEFDPPLSWKQGLKSGTHTEFFIYISNNGTEFDFNASNNYVVVKPTQTSHDFLHTTSRTSGTTGIPNYGKALGYSIGQPPYSYDYHCYWWMYTTAVETHADMGHLPGAVASQDSFGWFGTKNTAIWDTDKYLIKMAR